MKARNFAIVHSSQKLVGFVYLRRQGWLLYKEPGEVARACGAAVRCTTTTVRNVNGAKCLLGFQHHVCNQFKMLSVSFYYFLKAIKVKLASDFDEEFFFLLSILKILHLYSSLQFS